MSKFVRATLDNGAHVSVTEEYAEAHSLRILKQPGVDRAGRTLRDKPKTTADEAGSKKNNPSGSGDAATNQEESK